MNELNLYISKLATFTYTNREVFARKLIKNIHKLYTKLKFQTIFIESKFNNINYPFYDLDDDDKLNNIKKILDKIEKTNSNSWWYNIKKAER